MKREYYSPSQINTYVNCPAQWFFRYIEGLKIPPSASMALGSSFHDSIEQNYEQKIKTKIDLPTTYIKDIYDTKFKENFEAVEEPHDKGKTKDDGYRMIEVYQSDIAPSVQPKEVEKPFEVETDEHYTLKGRIDLIDVTNSIREHKTSAKTPSCLSPSYLFQGAVYSMVTGIENVQFDFAIRTKTAKTESLACYITDSDKEYAMNMIKNVNKAIENEVFYPNRNSMFCSRRGCGYWNHCQKKFGGFVKS